MGISDVVALRALHVNEAAHIAWRSGLARPAMLAVLAGYYGLSVVNAVVEGLGITLLLGLVARGGIAPDQPFSRLIHGVLRWLHWEAGFSRLLLLAAVLLTIRALLMFLFQAVDGAIATYARRKVQETAFRCVLEAPWEAMRHRRAGKMAGAITEECGIAAKYFISAARAVYFLIGTILFGVFALALDFAFSLAVVVLFAPVLLCYAYLFRKQAALATGQTDHRQGFAADVTERLHSLFQIKVEGRASEHFLTGRRHQRGMTRYEYWGALTQATLSALKFLLPALGLLLLYFWTRVSGQDVSGQLHLYAGIGFFGARAAAQADNLMSMIGVLTRFGGSLRPVNALMSLPREEVRVPVPTRVKGIELEKLGYTYQGSGKEIGDINLSIVLGKPTYLRGSSGSGKTTLINLIVGVLPPVRGKVWYRGEDSARYDSLRYRSAIGYVTQDIHLFQGTVRENLASFGGIECGDEDLWEALRGAGAEAFVERMGGLSATISEGGRSLSGGERRRVGIARALIGNPDILILDEVTAGLDKDKRKEVSSTIAALAKDRVVIVATHDPADDIEAAGQTFFLEQSD